MTETGQELISVVMPTFNRRQFIREAVDSILGQTYGNVEVVIMDDGSTDGTKGLIDEVYGRDSRVRYFSQQNCGQAVARNKALALARGNYIAFLDSDDVWEPEKLAKQMPLFLSDPEVQLVHSGCSMINTQGAVIQVYVPPRQPGVNCGDVFEQVMEMNRMACMTVVVRRAILEKAGGFDEDRSLDAYAVDWELWMRLSLSSKVDYVAEALARYRVHTGTAERKLTETEYLLLVRKIGRKSSGRARMLICEAALRRFNAIEFGNAGKVSRLARLRHYGRMEMALGSSFILYLAKSWWWRFRVKRMETK